MGNKSKIDFILLAVIGISQIIIFLSSNYLIKDIFNILAIGMVTYLWVSNMKRAN